MNVGPLPSSLVSQTTPVWDNDLNAIAKLASERSGIVLSSEKAPMIKARIGRRVKALGLKDYREYLGVLDQGKNADEVQELISVLTTNVTSLFRENHHFEYIEQNCLPTLSHRAHNGERIRIWSAGCSSGAEPVSIALCILNFDPSLAQCDVKILATDIDRNILPLKDGGQFTEDAVNAIPYKGAKKYFQRSSTGNTWSPTHQVRNLITYRQLNLLSTWPFNGPFDIIFCRNVAIYFDNSTQTSLWSRFTGMLVDEGHLFIGHSERIDVPDALTLRPVHTTSYKKSLSDPKNKLLEA